MLSKDLDIIRAAFARHLTVAQSTENQLAGVIAQAAVLLIDCLANGRKILLCGNGGSAADAQHFAAELTGRYIRERRGLSAIALTTDSSAVTAIGNDYGFDRIFARQVEALARPGDILIAISTSGNSSNILEAIKAAGTSGCRTIALVGRGGGAAAPLVDLALIVPSDETPAIQEMHIVMIHLLCELIDRQFGTP